MAVYKVKANRSLFYELDIEANSIDEALEKIEEMEADNSLDRYEQQFYPIEIELEEIN